MNARLIKLVVVQLSRDCERDRFHCSRAGVGAGATTAAARAECGAASSGNGVRQPAPRDARHGPALHAYPHR